MPRRAQASRPSWASIRKLARERFGVTEFRPGQRALVRAPLDGEHALGVLPTGAGKSLTFQLPALLLPGITVVVSPLLALIQDQTTKLEDAGLPVVELDSTLAAQEERDAAREVRHGDAPLVYVTPERLERPDVIAMLRARGVALLVVDEAHCVSQWGHDFRPAYLSIRDAHKALGAPPVLALTATATPEVEKDVLAQLEIPDALVVRGGTERPNLFFEVTRTPSEDAKEAALASALREVLAEGDGAAIVYAATTKTVDALFETLGEKDIPCVRYHGKMPAKARKESQDRFMRGEVPVVVATSAFGLGVDKADVRLVAHYNFPDSLESFVQEAGRAGRDGEPARARLLYRLEDRRVQSFFLGGKYPRQDEMLRAYDALVALSPRAAGLAELAEAAALGEKRTKVVVARLDAMGVARRAGGRVPLRRRFRDAAELAAYTREYEARFETDKEKLEDMMRYAQSTACRVRTIAEYFGEPHDADCGHCDNCRDAPALALAEASPRDEREDAARAELPPALAEGAGLEASLAPGDVVEHPTFGRGAVEEVESDHVRVRFDRVGEKVVHPDYLRVA